MTGHTPSVLILGIGNLLWADEGFGVRAVEHLHRHWPLPPMCG
jgi:hydrogenase maturation protease